MRKYYWTLESWGSDRPPEDAEIICDLANAAIAYYADNHPEASSEDLTNYSEKLWEEYCSGSGLKLVYIAKETRYEMFGGDSYDLLTTFDLEEAMDAVLRDWSYLTPNERGRCMVHIDVIRGFGDTPEDVVGSHLVGLGWIDIYNCLAFNEETKTFY